MKLLLLLLPLLLALPGTAEAQRNAVDFTNPTDAVTILADGTRDINPVPADTPIRNKIYYGTSSGALDSVHEVPELSTPGAKHIINVGTGCGIYYFAVTATAPTGADGSWIESGFSNIEIKGQRCLDSVLLPPTQHP